MADIPFIVSHATWVKTEADRIQGILLMPKFWNQVWNHKRLQRSLENIGLIYTLEQVAELNDELHTRGVVVDVKVELPAPATDPVATEPA